MDPTTYSSILYFLAVLTTICQGYLFYAILTKSPKSMSNYRFFLNYFTFWDLTFIITFGILLQPDPTGRPVAVRTRGIVSYLGPKAEMIATGLFVYEKSNMLISQIYCLLYRYTSIRTNTPSKNIFITSKSKVLCCLVGQLCSFAIAFVGYKCIIPPEHLNANYMTTEQFDELNAYRITPGEFVIWTDLNSRLLRSWMATILVLFVMLEALSVLLVYLILTELRKNKSVFSEATYKLNVQLTMLLAIQLATPLLIVVLPISVRITTVILQVKLINSNMARIGFLLVTSYGLTNAIFTIIFVTPFRVHFYKSLIFPWLRHILAAFGIKNVTPTNNATIYMLSSRIQYNRNAVNRKISWV